MAELEKISMADMKKAIGKSWIANVKEDEIMQNPLLAMIAKKSLEEGMGTTGRTTRDKGSSHNHGAVIDMFLKCPQCQHSQHTYVYQLDDKKWIKCQACDELSPSGAWAVITVGNKVK